MLITDAACVVAGGRGIGGHEGICLLEELALLIGADIAATRGAVEAGWLSEQQIVGLSGKRIAPKLYIAFGISGANFHTIGIKNAGFIAAINHDKKAPIFQMADICIVADSRTVMRKLIHKLKSYPHLLDEMNSEQKIQSIIEILWRMNT